MIGASALIGVVGAVAVLTQISATRSLALKEAESVAEALAATIAFKAPDAPAPWFDRPAALSEFVASQHRRSKGDIVIVDKNETIIADIPGEEQNVGTRYDGDHRHEVEQTLQDGIARS